jgi:hypothetical protein
VTLMTSCSQPVLGNFAVAAQTSHDDERVFCTRSTSNHKLRLLVTPGPRCHTWTEITASLQFRWLIRTNCCPLMATHEATVTSPCRVSRWHSVSEFASFLEGTPALLGRLCWTCYCSKNSEAVLGSRAILFGDDTSHEFSFPVNSLS